MTIPLTGEPDPPPVVDNTTVLEWIKKRLGVNGAPTPDILWQTDEPIEPIPQQSDTLTTKAAKVLVENALNTSDPITGLIRVDAILKASVDYRVRVLLDEFAERAANEGKPAIACAKGCGYCCCVSVSSFPFEIFAIVDHVRRTWSASAIKSLKARIRDYRKKAMTLKKGEQHPYCPFLQNECCSIHSVRPLICRTHHSTNVNACIRNRTMKPPGAEPFYAATIPIYTGVYKALDPHTSRPNALDMALAVGTALENPEALHQFTNGEDPFISARQSVIRSISR